MVLWPYPNGPRLGPIRILKLACRHIKWGLISKLLMSPFSWWLVLKWWLNCVAIHALSFIRNGRFLSTSWFLCSDDDVTREMTSLLLQQNSDFQLVIRYTRFVVHENACMSHEEEQNNFFCWCQVVLAWGLFEGFFGLKKAKGLLKAKKIPQTARRPKQAWLKQNKIFCSSEWWEMSCIDPKMPFF